MPYFFDTYALVEIINGNEGYNKFVNESVIVSILNIGELYLVNLGEFDKEHALNLINKFKFQSREITKDVIIYAMDFKNKYNKRDYSWADCIGYALSKKHKIKFLTGDKQFENMENVEFVK
jgi:uncharacterized protein